MYSECVTNTEVLKYTASIVLIMWEILIRLHQYSSYICYCRASQINLKCFISLLGYLPTPRVYQEKSLHMISGKLIFNLNIVFYFQNGSKRLPCMLILARLFNLEQFYIYIYKLGCLIYRGL